MKLAIGSPSSTFVLSEGDDMSIMTHLYKAFTANLRVFSGGYGPPQIMRMPLIDSEDGVHYVIRTGLIPRLRRLTQGYGVILEEVDMRSTPQKVNGLVHGHVELRDYQEEALKLALDSDMGLVHMSTGGGKTHVGAALIEARSVSCLFLVHTKELLWQTKKKFEELFKVEIGVIGDGERKPLPITISTVQTLCNMIDNKEDLPGWDMVIVDEAHHVAAPMFYKATSAFAARYVHGLTATPKRKDGGDLIIEAAAGPILTKTDTDDLIDSGHLAKPYYLPIPTYGEMSYSKAPRHAIINKYIVKDRDRNLILVDKAIEHHAKGESVLMTVDWVKHAVILQELLAERGFYDAVTLDGQVDSDQRKVILDSFRRKETRLVISTLVKEGVDIPSLNVLIMCAGGTDPTQLIGRVLRTSEGKTHALIIDIIDNRHEMLYRNSMARIKKVRKMKNCMVLTEDTDVLELQLRTIA